MPGACRLTDKHLTPADSCGCSGCAHVTSGIVITGSDNMFANCLNAFRGSHVDMGDHSLAGCCGPNIYLSDECSPDVFVNGVGWVRLNDGVDCCGGRGHMISASDDIIIN